MVYWLILMLQAAFAAEPKCPAELFRFAASEIKLNLDGNSKPDAVVRFIANDGDRHFYRRALVLDAPPAIDKVSEEQWLEPCAEGGENPDVVTSTFEKVPAGGRDLLFARTEGGPGATFRYISAEAGRWTNVLHFSNSVNDGHFNETHGKNRLAVRIFGEGDLTVNGEKVDLDALALKARCRVRELFIEVKYEYDRKERRFREVDQGCVMGSAID